MTGPCESRLTQWSVACGAFRIQMRRSPSPPCTQWDRPALYNRHRETSSVTASRRLHFLQPPPGAATHWKSACFSVNTLTQKSPFLCGSKVEGTIRYSPGGSEKRLHTSRRLMKVSERAEDEWRRKKLRFRWMFLWPWY